MPPIVKPYIKIPTIGIVLKLILFVPYLGYAQYKGGYNNGTSMAFASAQSLSTLFPQFLGGIDDGFSSVTVTSQYLALPAFMPMYAGGISDGFTVGTASSQTLRSLLPMYIGGSDDGYAFSVASNQLLGFEIIIPPTGPRPGPGHEPPPIESSSEQSEMRIFSYPNPVSDEFRIEKGASKNHEVVTATFTDLHGQVIAEKILYSSAIFDVRDLAQGLYLITLSSTQGIIGTIKIQVIH
ncbi:MAG: T9SS C-terminal target domain-containing protein [Bacteroidetes bacterium CHB5]|nr:T9SS C-terminal target domain-containing protein [Bacteroidetes bacterium CHB5]